MRALMTWRESPPCACPGARELQAGPRDIQPGGRGADCCSEVVRARRPANHAHRPEAAKLPPRAWKLRTPFWMQAGPEAV